MDIFYNKTDIIKNKILNYYKENPLIIDEIILPIINGEDAISLRFIEYFVTKYAKEKNIIFHILDEDNTTIKKINIYDSYKNYLHSYDKKLFDPFKRTNHLLFQYKEDAFIHTSIGQLNFFYWLITSGIYQYISENYNNFENVQITN